MHDLMVFSLSCCLFVCCSDSVEEEEVAGDVNSLTLTGLRPFTTYNVSVSARTVKGAGPPATTEFTTEEAGKLSPLSLSLSVCAVCIEWREFQSMCVYMYGVGRWCT